MSYGKGVMLMTGETLGVSEDVGVGITVGLGVTTAARDLVSVVFVVTTITEKESAPRKRAKLKTRKNLLKGTDFTNFFTFMRIRLHRGYLIREGTSCNRID